MTNEIDSSEDKAVLPKSFGAAFREAREKAGFSIERAAVATRISASFIEALEKQNFDVLPGEIFGRGFVRNLSRVYGCDAKPLVTAYDLAFGKQAEVHVIENGRDAKPKAVRTIQTPAVQSRSPLIDRDSLQKNAEKAWKVAKPIAVGLPIILGVVWLGQVGYRSYKASTTKVETLEAAAPVAVAPTPVETTPAAPVVTEQPTVPATPVVVKGEGAEFVEIIVKEPVDIRFGRDKDKQIQENFAAQSYRLQFNEQLRLYVADMSRVEIRFKDQVIPNRAQPGEARYMTFAQSEATLAKSREKTKL